MFGKRKNNYQKIQGNHAKKSFFSSRLGRALRTLTISTVALGLTAYLGMYLFNKYIKSSDQENTVASVSETLEQGSLNDRVAAYALHRTEDLVIYHEGLPNLDYPNGDLPLNKGMDIDLIIRAYRNVGFDFQQAIHEDILENYDEYPKLWDLQAPNSSVDHRRVENLLYYLSKYAEMIPAEVEESALKVGDIVAWRLSSGELHLGILVPVKERHNQETFWVAHNFGEGPVWANDLKRFSVVNYYRFSPQPVSE